MSAIRPAYIIHQSAFAITTYRDPVSNAEVLENSGRNVSSEGDHAIKFSFSSWAHYKPTGMNIPPFPSSLPLSLSLSLSLWDLHDTAVLAGLQYI